MDCPVRYPEATSMIVLNIAGAATLIVILAYIDWRIGK